MTRSPQGSRPRLLVLIILPALLTSMALVAPPAAQAVTPRVTVKLSTAVVTVGQSVRATVTVRRGVAGQKVSLQRQHGRRWVGVTSKSLPRKGKVKRVALTFRPTLRTRYRVLVARKGPVKTATQTLRMTVKPRPATTTPKVPLRFNLDGAAGLAIAPATAGAAAGATLTRAAADTTTTKSNLDVVTPDGETRDAVTSGTATVESFLIAPNDKVYVLFRGRVDLTDTTTYSSTGCLLAEVDPVSGLPRCVDNTLDSIRLGKNGIQFDASGAIYYRGWERSTPVLRRYSAGAVSDFINPNITIHDWHVLPHGWILTTGHTNSTGARWTRALNPQGGLATLYGEDNWGSQFPDGNFYFYESSCAGPGGLRRFDTSTLRLDPQFYIRPISQPTASIPPECDGPRSVYFDSLVGQQYTTPDGRVVSYQFINNGWKALRVARVYPTSPAADGGGDFDPADSAPGPVTSDDGFYQQTGVFSGGMTRAEPVGSSILFAGIDAGRNKLVAFDLNEWTLHDIALPDEIEFYNITAAEENTAMFDGLRFSDNRTVVGRIDLATGQVEILSALSLKWNDFQTF